MECGLNQYHYGVLVMRAVMRLIKFGNINHEKVKLPLVRSRGGPQGCELLRIPHNKAAG
jgi:hypothetical protein